MSLATLSAVVVALALVGLSVSEDGPLPVERAFGTCDPKCDPCTPALTKQSIIEPVPGLRATVELIPDYGNCPTTYRGYRWYVSWGDGVSSVKNVSALTPQQAQYTYVKGGSYNVTISFCSYPFYCCESCSSLWQVITIA